MFSALRHAFLILLTALMAASFAMPCGVAFASGAKKEENKKEEGKKEEGKKEEGKKEGGKKDKGDSDISGGKFDGDPIYVHLQPVLVPMISDQGAEQIVTILIDVQVKSMTIADTFHSNMPRVKNAVFETLYMGFSDGTLRRGQAVNLPKVKTKIAKALKKTVGPDQVDDVLIQAVAQRIL